MSTDTMLVQIRSLEAQLAMLKADLNRVSRQKTPFATLYGVLKDVASTTEQEIEAAKLKVKVEPL
jgi:hypothetical protein